MRELTASEVNLVVGGVGECTASDGNNIGGVSDSGSLGSDLVNIYEGLVQVTSHVIERVANAL